MLLGVYWYYGFPEGLYHFDYFTFRRGLGGHADGPASLTVTVHAAAPARLLEQVRAVAARYPEAWLFAQAHDQVLRLTLDDYSLSDYVFHVAGELEAVLRQEQVTPTTTPLPTDTPLLRLTQPPDTPPYRYGGILQAVSSSPGNHNAQTSLLRLDCHLPLAHQSAFFQDLDLLSQQFELDVLYYFDRQLGEHVNLMVFFGNGRQGVGGSSLRHTDSAAVTTAVQQALTTHGGQPEHLGTFPKHYPRRGPYVIRMVDADFVL
ncbi:hypothetical protein [Hymenobacter sp. GOD-10R]|uniref:hypothetical protein n=1 Tax=Hymenobacter sp. GOD-10R TaxID=3093922 RepID=UPI002D7A29D0|nr:hypothetical protein [Hymenobacter sp. GOD-10R]WRQ31139.1 hypothetical protein SD425_12805 [Hymenobacter sp. GOD-10R]